MGHFNVPLFFFGMTFVMHFFFAMGVFSAARSVRARGDHLMFAPPVVWMFHTLLWGMFALVPYWLIHHSTLRSPKPAP